MKRPTFISLFAGCGGSTTGYKLAGYKSLLAVDWKEKAPKRAWETYRVNHKRTKVLDADISKLRAEECMKNAGVKKGELDLLDASPPCQGFSQNNTKNRKLENEKNRLVDDVIRLVDGMQPKTFVMENVEGFIRYPMTENAVRVIESFEACGYSVRARLLNSRNYGVAQSRPRVFIIGIRNDIGLTPTFPPGNEFLIPCGQLLRYDGRLLSDDVRDRFRQSKFFRGKFVDLRLPFPTFTKGYGSGGESPIIRIGDEFYLLSAMEAKLISSFPKNYEFKGSRNQIIQQIGNCVPPLLTYAVAKNIRKLVFDGSSMNSNDINRAA